VVVHLAAALLTVVDYVESCTLQEPYPIEGRVVLYLLSLSIGETFAFAKNLGQVSDALDAEALVPRLRFLYS
jgi:hypothetical protein